ncbi:MAG: hypothetical protein ISQ14_12105 [Verrucomicrobiae bacterium]|nr:hypothetical protein [Verrucomicrobiae bacterium]
MPLIDTGYHHYEGRYRGVWYRRATITSVGLRACLVNPWMKRILSAAWLGALALVTLLFFVGQLLVKDSIAFTLIENLNPGLRALFNGIMGWLVGNPEVSVHTVYNFAFYQFATGASFLGLIAIAIAIPHLITTDLASRAVLVYSSKAVNRFDYFLGKFGVVFSLLFLTWLGPILAAWALSNLLAPNWSFFIHSRHALLNSICYVGASMVVLSVLALGISATSTKEKTTGSTWIGLWLLGNAFIPLGQNTKPWLKHLSFSFDLNQLALHFFQLRRDVDAAAEQIPIIGSMLERASRRGAPGFMNDAELPGALIALAVMLLLAIVILVKRVKPE